MIHIHKIHKLRNPCIRKQKSFMCDVFGLCKFTHSINKFSPKHPSKTFHSNMAKHYNSKKYKAYTTKKLSLREHPRWK